MSTVFERMLAHVKKTDRPLRIVLCGSTKNMEWFEAANAALTLKGKIVISVGYAKHGHQLDETASQNLDILHFQKLDIADVAVVLNVNGYIGTSTSREIAYCTRKKIPVSFLEEDKSPSHVCTVCGMVLAEHDPAKVKVSRSQSAKAPCGCPWNVVSSIPRDVMQQMSRQEASMFLPEKCERLVS